MIRVVLPSPLRDLAGVAGEVEVALEGAATTSAVLAAIEERFPELRGTLRDQISGRRRPFVRFFAAGRDLSHEPGDFPLPTEVTSGAEPFVVLGAIAGG